MVKRFILLAICLVSIGFPVQAHEVIFLRESIPVIELPSAEYPETAQHVEEAILKGKTDLCTVDREGADQRRKESLEGIPTKKGYDRDEFPMAVCREGGKGAHVKYVSPSDNRGAGSHIGNQLGDYADGQKVRIVVK
ncbi:NucA/NucB deoxyribonuclease domain-containing protein [Thermoactinomyces sp. DSM 45892]|uniref:NucA/NucB deoxyribonuclease domain-containing protein n=1 Tax=Thermoactinomyces sp. DSM 45892 TaxID=1882753 RepID=UPI00089715AC|nr:NucA/NucB deoxyribonuclease domain-containing protein [Thermoactinomyces sp. DSM 45892]SDX96425.1 Deoxyribonuclease NucA/NucB [Thermoactinomyces sp. DSM 45892]